MNFYNLFYLFLLALSFILSFRTFKSEPGNRLLTVLLLLSIITEAAVYTMYYLLELRPHFFIAYHFYIPFEYGLIARYLINHISNSHIKKIILISIPSFLIASILISFFRGVFTFPGVNLNLEGFLIIVWTIISLFSLRPSKVPLLRQQFVWVGVGFLVYYSGSFFFNFVYQFLVEEQSDVALKLNGIINKGLNYLLYTFFCISFICSQRRNYTRP